MMQSVTSWVVLSAFLIALAMLVIFSRRNTMLRGLGVFTALLALPVAGWALTMVLGWAAPIWLHNIPQGDWLILGNKMVHQKAIYLLLDIPGAEPRLYRMPWDEKQARKLQDAMNRKEKAMLRFDPSLEQFMEIHPLPQPKFPIPKAHPPKPPKYERGA